MAMATNADQQKKRQIHISAAPRKKNTGLNNYQANLIPGASPPSFPETSQNDEESTGNEVALWPQQNGDTLCSSWCSYMSQMIFHFVTRATVWWAYKNVYEKFTLMPPFVMKCSKKQQTYLASWRAQIIQRDLAVFGADSQTAGLVRVGDHVEPDQWEKRVISQTIISITRLFVWLHIGQDAYVHSTWVVRIFNPNSVVLSSSYISSAVLFACPCWWQHNERMNEWTDGSMSERMNNEKRTNE